MYIGFDGSTDYGPRRSVADVSTLRDHGFISQIYRQLMAHGELTEYWDGPHKTGFAVRGIVEQGVDFVLTNVRRATAEGLIVGGYSRGGLIAIHVSSVIDKLSAKAEKAIASVGDRRQFQLAVLTRTVQKLRERAHVIREEWGGVEGGFTPVGPLPRLDADYFDELARVRINGLLLLDPVGMTPGASSNRKLTRFDKLLHLKRSKFGCSRLYFKNIKFTGDYKSVYATHAALGGLPGSSKSKSVKCIQRDWCFVTPSRDIARATSPG